MEFAGSQEGEITVEREYIESGTVTVALEKVDRATGREFKVEHLYLDAKDYCLSDDEHIDHFAAFLKEKLHQLDPLRQSS